MNVGYTSTPLAFKVRVTFGAEVGINTLLRGSARLDIVNAQSSLIYHGTASILSDDILDCFFPENILTPGVYEVQVIFTPPAGTKRVVFVETWLIKRGG